MKAMTSFTVKSLRDSAARTIVTIAGVTLAAALLVAVLSLSLIHISEPTRPY